MARSGGLSWRARPGQSRGNDIFPAASRPRWDLLMRVPKDAEEVKTAAAETLRLTAYQYCAECPGSDLAEVRSERKISQGRWRIAVVPLVAAVKEASVPPVEFSEGTDFNVNQRTAHRHYRNFGGGPGSSRRSDRPIALRTSRVGFHRAASGSRGHRDLGR
jgi:hypothetical protein